jgi:hypothetical protein
MKNGHESPRDQHDFFCFKFMAIIEAIEGQAENPLTNENLDCGLAHIILATLNRWTRRVQNIFAWVSATKAKTRPIREDVSTLGRQALRHRMA